MFGVMVCQAPHIRGRRQPLGPEALKKFEDGIEAEQGIVLAGIDRLFFAPETKFAQHPAELRGAGFHAGSGLQPGSKLAQQQIGLRRQPLDAP